MTVIKGMGIKLPGISRDKIQEEIAREMWEWFEANRGTEVTTIKKWWFSFTVKVKHLQPLFVILFGEPK